MQKKSKRLIGSLFLFLMRAKESERERERDVEWGRGKDNKDSPKSPLKKDEASQNKAAFFGSPVTNFYIL